MTNTRVDHHHRSLYQPAAGALEGHLGGGGLIRRAAAGVGALPAVPQLVGTGAVAALVDEPDGARRRVAGLAPPLLPPLRKQTHTHRGNSGEKIPTSIVMNWSCASQVFQTSRLYN